MATKTRRGLVLNAALTGGAVLLLLGGCSSTDNVSGAGGSGTGTGGTGGAASSGGHQGQGGMETGTGGVMMGAGGMMPGEGGMGMQTGGMMSISGGAMAGVGGGTTGMGGVMMGAGGRSMGRGGMTGMGGIQMGTGGRMMGTGGLSGTGGMVATGGSSGAGACHAAGTIMVTNSGMTAYVMDGVSNPPLTLCRGSTYTFAVNATGHPFYIKTVQGAGTGNAYSDGVTGNGATNGDVVFAVPASAPDTLYYNCSLHAAMTGTIHIVD